MSVTNIKFKTTDSLFGRIKDDFNSYDNAGLIDEGRFHDYVKYILHTLGVKWYLTIETFLDVESYQTKLPDDFYQMDYALMCECSYVAENTPGLVLQQQIFSKYAQDSANWDPHASPCKDACEHDNKCVFNTYENILIPRGQSIYKYSKPRMLSIGNISTRKYCSKDCVNVFSNSPDTIAIENNKIYTNFETGAIYLVYKSFPIDDETGLPLIPDNPKIEKCIEDYIKYNIIKNLATNKDADVINLISLYKQDYTDSLSDAITETKLPEFREMVDAIRKSRKSLDVFYQIDNKRY